MTKSTILELNNLGLQADGPKYVNLAHKLVRKIARDDLQPGDLLATEELLIKEYNLSRVTIRKALALLESEGLIERKQRRGTVVKKSIDLKSNPHLFCGTVVIGIPHERQLDPQADMALFTTFTAIVGELDRRGFTSQIIRLSKDIDENRQAFQRIIRSTNDLEGVCVIGFDPSYYKQYLKDYPVVSLGTYRPVPGAWVGIDLAQITLESIRYLLDHGHKSIGLLCGPWVENTSFGDFVEGYRQAHTEREVEFHRDMLYMAYEGEDLTELAKSVLDSSRKPTAVFADDWRSCQAVVTASRELGLNIPEDISIISVGQNTTYMDSVQITSYVADNAKIGRQAAEILSELIDNKPVPEMPKKILGRIIERESVRDLPS